MTERIGATIRATRGDGEGARWETLLRAVGVLVISAGLLFIGDALAFGQATTETQNAEAASEALRGEKFPWYDAERDAVRPIDLAPDPNETGQRDSTWLSSGDFRAPQGSGRTRTVDYTLLRTFFQGLFWFLVGALLLGIAYMVVVAFIKMDARAASGGAEEEEDEEEEDKTRIENLPFQVKRTGVNFLSEAQACYERGDYNDAIVYLYSHQLLELDRRHAIHLTKGKTNRQYLRELRERPSLQGMLEETVLVFEEAFFGRHTITREKFERCWERMPEFSRELERIAA